ncbi:polyketide synthase [Pseudoxanthomonas sp. PXM02]|uniref:polyketide synthase n=1 Tax=Pseudoxanthomonas sp. PXM02 TaxID=2769294 RepID=UPI00272DEE27|nr:polyketide synthase [Pseudoxanthomonas sp. PXM02]
MQASNAGSDTMSPGKVHGSSALAGAPALIELPLDRPRGAIAPRVDAHLSIGIDAALQSAIASFASRSGTSAAQVSLAAWILLLHRISAQDDLVLAVPSGERLLPLRVELDPGISFAGLVGHVVAAQRQIAEAASADAPQVVFGPRAGEAAELALVVTGQDLPTDATLHYASSLLEPGTARRFLGYWRQLLSNALRDPEMTIARVPMIDADERRALLERWNDTRTDYDLDVCLHTLIEAQVRRTPHAPAVVAGDAQLDFAALNARANQLARHLRTLGVRTETRVGICAERGLDMVVGLLAILKAGGAYVPLDPHYPQDRLAHMLSDSAPVALLTQAALRPVLASLDVRCPVLDLTEASPPWARESADDIAVGESGVGPRNLAYMIYTSGSTGLPKGAMNEHRGIVNRLLWMQEAYGLDAHDTVLQKTPFSFDVSVWEFFWPLLTGARLVMARPEGHKDPAYLAQLIRSQRVTTLHFVPSMLHAFLEHPDAGSCAGVLERVMCSGEALPASLVDRFHQVLPGVELHNLYGPTEAAVDVTAFACTPGVARVSIPIGKPIANTRMYVLDACGEPVPQGVAGELFIAGVQVGRGYLNRDELTAERFLRDPFAGDNDARMYRTGDLGRWLPDGNIEYLGRNDFQVKIRGFRIELGEIEARLLAHPQVSGGVVLAIPGADGELRLVAYYVPRQGDVAISVQDFRAHLSQHLPEHMVPALFVRLETLPVTPNGKLDRRALPAPDNARPELATAYEPPATATERSLCEAFTAILGVATVGRHDNFFDLGGNSLLAMRLLERVRRDRASAESDAAAVPATVFFRDPTPAGLAMALDGQGGAGLDAARLGRGRNEASAREPIALIAMAGRFPGASTVEAFWQNLLDGRDTITLFKPEELDPSIPASERQDPAYVAARGIIDGLEQFDAGFFGISPREAELMDPQQRIFLELCWECLERGGYAPDATPGPVGVFAGMNNATYFQHHLAQRPDLIEKLGAFQVMVNNEKDYIATRVAHKLNLTGPAVSTHTACSTSLVAICQAVDSLRAGQCDMALAGAASATCPPNSGYRHIEGAMLSPDGHTRAFDEQARGTVFSDGAAVVLLKRLSDALADGDTIHALIRGAAINNDGGQKASFTAPSSDGQAAVIAMAQADAGVSPRDIGYVEAHGTATPLGDPIEIEGLTKAFRRGTADTGFCRVGSVKSNVGHLVIAAGAAGVIKTACALREERIPATVHFTRPNPTIDFASTPFVVNGALTDWKRNETAPRLAGVSSFGVGGTNAHVVMEEAPPAMPTEAASGPQVLVLSARTPTALGRAAQAMADHFDVQRDINLADAAWTLGVGRKAFPHRIAVTADDAAHAVSLLRSPEISAAIARGRPAHATGTVFLFPGQGSQYAGMGRALYAAEPHFREAFDACADGLRKELGFDLRDVVFGDDADALLPTSVMQPAIFSIEYSLARLWMSLGVTPSAMLGHSIGEFAAATLAGVFSLEDALTLVARRGRLMQSQPTGSMLSVRMPADALAARLPATLSLAAENAPGACVVSGPSDAVAAFQAVLEGEGTACRPLHTSHAFHSAMMDAVVDQFRAEVAAVPRHAPQLPVLSTATVQWLDEATATSPDYWAQHLRQPVRFSAALLEALALPAGVMLEVGTRTTLSALSRQHPQLAKAQKVAVSSLADSPQTELSQFRQAAGQLWAHGVAIDLHSLDRRTRKQRICLPTYAFERQRYWIEASPAASATVLPHPAVAAQAQESQGLHLVESVPGDAAAASGEDRLVVRLRALFEDAAGLEVTDADTHFIEAGLDSLMLTQIALRLQKTFGVKVTFRQLMGECATLATLAAMLAPHVPAEVQPAATPVAVAPVAPPLEAAAPRAPADDDAGVRAVVDRQLQLMSQQLALLMQAGTVDADTVRNVVQQQHALMARQLSLVAGGARDAVQMSSVDSAAAEMPVQPQLPVPSSPAPLPRALMDARHPVAPGARLGRSPEGEPAWYVPDPDQTGRYLKVAG